MTLVAFLAMVLVANTTTNIGMAQFFVIGSVCFFGCCYLWFFLKKNLVGGGFVRNILISMAIKAYGKTIKSNQIKSNQVLCGLSIIKPPKYKWDHPKFQKHQNLPQYTKYIQILIWWVLFFFLFLPFSFSFVLLLLLLALPTKARILCLDSL